jgi:hypothetical protein
MGLNICVYLLVVLTTSYTGGLQPEVGVQLGAREDISKGVLMNQARNIPSYCFNIYLNITVFTSFDLPSGLFSKESAQV